LTRLFSFALSPGGIYHWSARPGEEKIDYRDGQIFRLTHLYAENQTRAVVHYTVDRQLDGSLYFSPGLCPEYNDSGLYKIAPDQVLPDPEFDLDEMAIGEELVKAGARLGKSVRS
jgi:hypothetical protein